MSSLRLSQHTFNGRAGKLAYGAFLGFLLLGGLGLSYQRAFEHVPWLWGTSLSSWPSMWVWAWAWFWTLLYTVGGLAVPMLLISYAVRGDAILTGTLLTVGGPFRTRSIDLAVAHVRGEVADDRGGTDTDADDGRVQLVASMPGTGCSVTLDLGSYEQLLSRVQLAALADAIAVGDMEDPGRHAVVERLRMFVRRPYAPPRYLWTDPPPLAPTTSERRRPPKSRLRARSSWEPWAGATEANQPGQGWTDRP